MRATQKKRMSKPVTSRLRWDRKAARSGVTSRSGRWCVVRLHPRSTATSALHADIWAEDRERQQAGGEPGVENVGLLGDVRRGAVLAGGGRLAGDGDLGAVTAVPCRDAMAPPELARDAPVVDVLHPLVVGLAVLVGRELDVALVDGLDGLGCDAVAAAGGTLVHADEPLLRQPRFDDVLGAVAEADGVLVILDGDEQPESFEIGDDLLAGLEARETMVRRAGQVDVRGRVHDGEIRQIVALADGEVVGVVRGRDLDGAGAELRIGPGVRDDDQVISRVGRGGSLMVLPMSAV